VIFGKSRKKSTAVFIGTVIALQRRFQEAIRISSGRIRWSLSHEYYQSVIVLHHPAIASYQKNLVSFIKML